jgi:hypothetical protein
MLRGRAFGGSRIAVFSLFDYRRCVASVAAEFGANGGGGGGGGEGAEGEAEQQVLAGHLAYMCATIAHETMHCFGLDHCGLFACCMNSWSDVTRE